jgi:hypothetical protein
MTKPLWSPPFPPLTRLILAGVQMAEFALAVELVELLVDFELVDEVVAKGTNITSFMCAGSSQCR